MNSVIINNLSCSYGKHSVLNNVSFEVKKNDLLFVMGNNGCGKTTLLKCILNSVSSFSGTIRIDDNIIKNISQKQFSKIVSYVPQNININCSYKVKDYLVLGRNPYIVMGNPKKKDFDIVEKYAIETGITDILNHDFHTLSGGQKQWVAITRALVQETPIIIMDEPMSALDLGKQAELLELLFQLKKKGKTIILTTHNPVHSLSIESNVCLIHNNHILKYGKAKEVLTRENINLVYGNKVKINQELGHISFKV